jgi:hypothetical protein
MRKTFLKQRPIGAMNVLSAVSTDGVTVARRTLGGARHRGLTAPFGSHCKAEQARLKRRIPPQLQTMVMRRPDSAY